MADFEYYCPRCEAKVAKWDFIAPPDFYRCWECLLATPFKDLPRRSILLVGRGPLISQRIPRGTGQTTSEQGQTQLVVPGIECGGGSLLVVGMSLATVPPETVLTGFTISWNGTPMTITDFVENGNFFGSSMAYLVVGPGGSGSLQIDSNDFNFEMALFATELTLPVGSNPIEGHGTDFDANPGSGPEIAIPSGTGKRSLVACLNTGTTALAPFWSPPVSDGQSSSGVLNVREGYSEIGASQATASGPVRIAGWSACAAAFRVQ